MGDYTADPSNNPTVFDLPDDGEIKPVSSINPTLEALADKAAHAQWAATDNTKSYPLASRTVQRVQRGNAIATTTAGVPDWNPMHGVPGVMEQVALAANSAIWIPLDLVHGATLTGLVVLVKGKATHGGTVANFPTFAIQRLDITLGSVSTIASDTDVGPMASYETVHFILGLASGLTEVVDNTLYKYTLQIDGEYGANSLAGLQFLGARALMTVTSQDPGGC